MTLHERRPQPKANLDAIIWARSKSSCPAIKGLPYYLAYYVICELYRWVYIIHLPSQETGGFEIIMPQNLHSHNKAGWVKE